MDVTTITAALALMEESRPFVLLTIVESRGSSPRHVGASMLVKPDGAITGTIGGGALEAAAIRNALTVLESKRFSLMDYELTNADSAGLGMICGGRGRVLLEYIAPTDGAAREIFEKVLEALTSGRDGWLVVAAGVAADTAPRPPRCLLDRDGAVTGDLPWSHETVLEFVHRSRTAATEAGEAGAEAYVYPISGQGTAYVFGAGHCGQHLVPVLSMLGFVTVIIDDRADFANRERFPSANRVVVPESPDLAVADLALGSGSYVVIMTRGHMHDRNVLREVLRTPATYVGMIGSRKKVTDTFQALRGEGVSPEDIARVHAPIGLSIAAETPEEIAISIAAELVQVRAQKRKY